MAFFVAGTGLVLFQNLTLEHRARQIMEPYVQLVAVGTDARWRSKIHSGHRKFWKPCAPTRKSSKRTSTWADGRLLASFNRAPTGKPGTLSAGTDGITLATDTAELRQGLPRGARLQLRMSLEQLNAQTRQALWMFGGTMLFLLTVTFIQLAVLRRTIVQPIANLTQAAELARSRAEYQHRLPFAGTDEVARLGRSFNAMMEAIQLRENELRRLSDFQRTILDNAAYGIIAATPDGIVTSFNRAAEGLLGYTADEVIGKLTPTHWHDPKELEQYAHRLSAELGETIPPGFEVFAALARRHLPKECEWTYVRKDGKRIPVDLSVTALRDEHGRITGFVGLSHDLAERKQAELAMHRLNRELRAISDCNEVLVRAEDEQTLLDDICRIVCEEAGYRMAWVGYVDPGAPSGMRVAASAGVELGYLDIAFAIRAATGQADAPTEVAVRTGEICGFSDVARDPAAAPWRAAALQRGYRSSISLPLKDKNHTFGVLSIYASEANAFTPEERRLLSELADDLAFGIATLRTRAEHRRAEEQIQIAATAFEAQEGIVITDANQVILRVNRAFTDITGYSADEAIGLTPRLLGSGRHEASFYRTMWDRINAEGSWQGEIWNRRKGGDPYPEWLTITVVRNAQGQVTHYVGTMIDITERKEAEQKIEHLAFYDLLTGLPNRRLFVDRLQQAMAGSARSLRMGALLFIDLDNFKIVNDTCGHDVGDRLLIEVARRLEGCVRYGDTISRLGGDEFVAMLEDLSEQPKEAAAQARFVAGKVLETLNQPYAIAGRVHHSTPSIGATLFVGNRDSVDELLKQADIAMYQAKSAGRNTLRFFDPEMQAAVAARASLEADLRQGVDRREFILHYQPQVDQCRRVIGAEALLRWQPPGHGMISPAQFIPLAEETDLILPIGQWVLEEACARLADWSRDAARSGINLAVNVSARQFRQPDFVDRVRQAIGDAGAPATHLKLELTESLVLDNVEDTIEKMRALKTLGVGFSMDDFGTGYSSLSYLTRLPLDQLKIDQSFVRNLPDSAADAVVVQSIITLAKSLGIAVIAEGVETEAQREFLEEHGCPIYQGYLFSKPVALAAFEEVLGHR